ncbi:hypothetical protein AB0I82_17845 [Streptomyces sp. NPDC050315]|uniref:hypothetical protein n=1 Tax=Streptomyces sp. NPDC050315 TaxID=3155039 RepID=UPI00341B826B
MDHETHERAELTDETDRTDWSAPTGGPAGNGEGAVCDRCGAVADGTPVTWTCSIENGARRYFCETCARTHLRAIESRLDSAWW